VNNQSAQDRHVVDIADVSYSNRHVSLGMWVYRASPQLLPESAVVRSRIVTQYDLLSHAIDANQLRYRASSEKKIACQKACDKAVSERSTYLRATAFLLS